MYQEKFIARNHAIKMPEDTKPTTLFEAVEMKWHELTDYKGIWFFLPFGWRMAYYDKIRPIWNDENKYIRKSIPRTWCDVTSLIVDVNFTMIKKFYEEEYVDGPVDWTATEEHRTFAGWLENAYQYITKERQKYEQAMDDAYPPYRPLDEMFKPIEKDGKTMYQMVSRGPYEEIYGEVNRLEKLIDELDTATLSNFIKYRHFFWT